MKKVLGILFSVVKGIAKSAPLVGGIINEIQSNKDSSTNGKGKVDKTRLVSYVLGGVLVIGRLVFPEVINLDLIDAAIAIFNSIAA